tara:strand:- start:18 stop:386 length:369 start_codon:yes stop_codon:yes gene_type:complete
MKKFMYFATGGAADGTGQAAAYEASKLVGVEPATTTTTNIYFERNIGEFDNRIGRDKITLTHDNATNTTGHRCKDIGKALAEAANAGPHVDGMTDIVDLDVNVFLANLSFVTGVAVNLSPQF